MNYEEKRDTLKKFLKRTLQFFDIVMNMIKGDF